MRSLSMGTAPPMPIRPPAARLTLKVLRGAASCQCAVVGAASCKTPPLKGSLQSLAASHQLVLRCYPLLFTGGCLTACRSEFAIK